MAFIKASSPEMRYRFKTRDNEIRREFERGVVGESWTASMRRSGYVMAAFTNALVDNPVWLASYRAEMAKNGATHEASARIADSAVRTNFGAGGVKDLSTYQDHAFWKHLTMFTGWFSSQYNAQRRIIRETKGLAAEERYIAAAGHIAVALLWRFAFMAVASEILSGRGPKDKEDAWAWALQRIAMYQMSLVPIVKEVSAAVDYGTDPRFGGISSLGKLFADAVKANWKAASDPSMKHGAKALKADLKFIGTLAGWPVSQADITGGYLWDLETGEAEIDWNTPHDLFFRRDEKRRR